MERHQTLLKKYVECVGKGQNSYNSAICFSFLWGWRLMGSQGMFSLQLLLQMGQRIKSSKESQYRVLLKSTLGNSTWLAHSETLLARSVRMQVGRYWEAGRTCDDDRSREIMRAANNIQPLVCLFLFQPTQSLGRLQCQMCQCISNTPLQHTPRAFQGLGGGGVGGAVDMSALPLLLLCEDMTECGTLSSTCKYGRKQL